MSSRTQLWNRRRSRWTATFTAPSEVPSARGDSGIPALRRFPEQARLQLPRIRSPRPSAAHSSRRRAQHDVDDRHRPPALEERFRRARDPPARASSGPRRVELEREHVHAAAALLPSVRAIVGRKVFERRQEERAEAAAFLTQCSKSRRSISDVKNPCVRSRASSGSSRDGGRRRRGDTSRSRRVRRARHAPPASRRRRPPGRDSSASFRRARRRIVRQMVAARHLMNCNVSIIADSQSCPGDEMGPLDAQLLHPGTRV